MSATLTKVAVIRRSGYPVGQPAPCYLNCPCGAQPPVDGTQDIRCTCGRIYSCTGSLQGPRLPALRAKLERELALNHGDLSSPAVRAAEYAIYEATRRLIAKP